MLEEVGRDDGDGNGLAAFVDDLRDLLVLDADHVLSVHLRRKMSGLVKNHSFVGSRCSTAVECPPYNREVVRSNPARWLAFMASLAYQ